MAESPEATPSARVPSVPRVLACGAAIVVIDAGLLGQGMLSVLVLLWMVFVALPLTLRKKYAGVRSQRLRNIGIYVGAAVLAGFLIVANLDMAKRRAETVVAAVNAYKTKHQRYPQTLAELVPEFMPAVPRAKYTWAFGEFVYRPRDGKPTLLYSVVAPYGARLHNFETGEWTETD